MNININNIELANTFSHRSIFIPFEATAGFIKTEAPNIKKDLNILDPTTFPTAISTFPFLLLLLKLLTLAMKFLQK